MDVSSLSSAGSSGQLAKAQAEYATTVFKKSLAITEQSAAQLVQIMAKSTGVGQNIDTTA